MDVVLSGKTSEGRDVAYLGVINNWRRDQRDYKEKIRRLGGGGGDHREQDGEKRKNNKIQLDIRGGTTHEKGQKTHTLQTQAHHIIYVFSALAFYSRTALVFILILWQHVYSCINSELLGLSAIQVFQVPGNTLKTIKSTFCLVSRTNLTRSAWCFSKISRLDPWNLR